MFFFLLSSFNKARKLVDFQKVVQCLTQVLANGLADGVVLQSLGQMGQLIAARDFTGALGKNLLHSY